MRSSLDPSSEKGNLKQDTTDASYFGESEKNFNSWMLDYSVSYLLVVLKSSNNLSFTSANLME